MSPDDTDALMRKLDGLLRSDDADAIDTLWKWHMLGGGQGAAWRSRVTVEKVWECVISYAISDGAPLF